VGDFPHCPLPGSASMAEQSYYGTHPTVRQTSLTAQSS